MFCGELRKSKRRKLRNRKPQISSGFLMGFSQCLVAGLPTEIYLRVPIIQPHFIHLTYLMVIGPDLEACC